MIGDILQPTHLLFVLVIALLVLGPKRLPEAGRSLGRGLRDFRKALSSDDHDEVAAPPADPAPTPAPASEPTADGVSAADATPEPPADVTPGPSAEPAPEPVSASAERLS